MFENTGMRRLFFKRGYKNVINKGIELTSEGKDCPLAIETSGHGALCENYFSDDGAYLCVKIICEMARLRKEGRRIEELIDKLGHPTEKTEIRLKITSEDFADAGRKMLEYFTDFMAAHNDMTIVQPNYEGIRVSLSGAVNGWFLLRMSLHDPILPLNIEASEPGGCDAIAAVIREYFSTVDGVDSSML